MREPRVRRDWLTALCCLWMVMSAFSLSITPPVDVYTGRPFTLGCKITRPAGDKSALFWHLVTDQTTSCIYVSSVCTSSIPLSQSSPAGLSGGCQHLNGEEVYTVTIENVTEDMDRSIWSCQFGSLVSNVTLDVQVLSVGGLSVTAPDDVVAGRPFTLRCKITRPASDASYLIWNRVLGQITSRIYASDECTSSIPVSSSSPAGLSGGCQHVNGEEVYTVTIENVTEDMDQGIWRCQYGGRSDQVTLDVKVMVTRVSLTIPSYTVLAGDLVLFTCASSGSKPPACIRGYIRSSGNVREIDPAHICNQYPYPVQTIARLLRFTASAEENGAELYCNASNSVTDPPVHSQAYTLNVQYSPQNGVLLSGYVNNTGVESGETLILTCQVGKGNPRPALSWSSGCGQTNTVPVNDGSQQISISITVSPSLNQKTCVCKGSQDRALTGWTGQESQTFNVTFGPDSVQLRADSGQSGNTVTVTENSTVTFTCTIGESNPAAVLSWYNNSSPVAAAERSDVSLQRGPNHGYLTTQRHTMRVDRYQDGDVIRCEAQRPVNGGRKRVSSNLTLEVTYAPQVTCNSTQVTVFEGQRLKISCDVTSKDDVVILWYKSGRRIDNAVTTNIRGPARRDVTISTVEFESAYATLSGVYQIEATNGIGSSHRKITIRVIEGQFIPQELRVISCTDKEASLIWASGLDDSLVEYYKLEYKGTDEHWKRELVRNPGRVKLVAKTLQDLKPEVAYQFRLQPNSDIALSNYATANCTIQDSQPSRGLNGGPEPSLSRGGMLGVGVVIGAAVVTIIAVSVTCWLRQKTPPTGHKERESDKLGTEQAMRVIQERRTEDRTEENTTDIDPSSHVQNLPDEQRSDRGEEMRNAEDALDPASSCPGHYEDLDTRPNPGSHYETLSHDVLSLSSAGPSESRVYANTSVL